MFSLSVKFNSEEENQTRSNRSFKFRAVILFVKLSVWRFRWQTSLVALVCRTWHLYGWMHLNGSNISPLSLLSLPVSLSLSLSVAVVGHQSFCCRDDHGCHQRSQMKGGLYPHLCPSLLTPLSLSLPLSVIPHPSPHLNNEQSQPPVLTTRVLTGIDYRVMFMVLEDFFYRIDIYFKLLHTIDFFKCGHFIIMKDTGKPYLLLCFIWNEKVIQQIVFSVAIFPNNILNNLWLQHLGQQAGL